MVDAEHRRGRVHGPGGLVEGVAGQTRAQALLVTTIVAFARQDRIAAWLLVPYPA